MTCLAQKTILSLQPWKVIYPNVQTVWWQKTYPFKYLQRTPQFAITNSSWEDFKWSFAKYKKAPHFKSVLFIILKVGSLYGRKVRTFSALLIIFVISQLQWFCVSGTMILLLQKPLWKVTGPKHKWLFVWWQSSTERFSLFLLFFLSSIHIRMILLEYDSNLQKLAGTYIKAFLTWHLVL